jgi:hypothetical protein
MVDQIAMFDGFGTFESLAEGETGLIRRGGSSIEMTKSGPCSSVGRARPW